MATNNAINKPNFTLKKQLSILLSFLLAAGIFILWDHSPALADSSEGDSIRSTTNANWLKPFETTTAQSNQQTAYCRFGVNLSTLVNDATSNIASYDMPSLGLGWYIDYQARANPPRPNNIEYAQMIRVKSNIGGTTPYTYTPHSGNLWATVTNNPGSDWFIGNEPDRQAFQDGVLPAIYAEAYNEVYYKIKNLDPTAKIFAGSIVQPTEVRLEYLDEILASYQAQFGVLMPVDGWSIHNFILNEASCAAFNDDLGICWGADMPPGATKIEGMRIDIGQHHSIDIFKQQIVRFRQWMTANGYAGLPVYLSEYGVLLPDWYQPQVDFSPAAISQFMSATFDYMLSAKDPALGDPNDDYRLIQRFSWYSVNDDYLNGGQYNGNLFKPTSFTKTDMGLNYQAYTTNLSDEVNIYISDMEFIPNTPPANSTTPVTHTVRMTIANSGNLLTPSTNTVSLYDDDPSDGGQQIIPDFDVTLAGCGEHVVVEKEWVVAPADMAQLRRFVRSGSIYLPERATYLPLINK